MKKVKLNRFFVVLLALLSCLGFTGCMQSIELSERALVQAIGIDKENGEYVVSIQYFSPENGGGQAMLDISKPNNYIVTSRGSTLMEALAKAEQRQGKDIFYIHNRLLIIGREAAQEGISYLTEYFSGNDDIKADVNVCIADSKASDVVGAQPGQGILPADSIYKLLSSAKNYGQTAQCELISVTRKLVEQNGDVVLPVVQIQQEEEELVTLTGLALFHSFHLQEILPQEECTGFLFTGKSVQRRALVLDLDEQRKVTLTTVGSNTSMKLSKDQSRLNFTIKVTSIVAEVVSELPSALSDQDMDVLEREQKQEIEQAVQEFYEKHIRESGADYFGLFSNTELSQEDVRRLLSQMTVTVAVKPHIRRNNQQP